MTGPPLISVVTATWRRHDFLLNRCIPSIEGQSYPAVQHVIVSDGPDDELADIVAARPVPPGQQRIFATLPEHAAGIVGGRTEARRLGIELASGDLLGYLDDDDAYRACHLQVLWMTLAADPSLDWAWSDMARHGRNEDIVGSDYLGYGSIGTPQFLHHRRLLDKGTWGRVSDQEDWDLVRQWVDAGAKGKHVRQVTVDAWPEEWRTNPAGLSWFGGL